jgi:molecular chaperone DnaJ
MASLNEAWRVLSDPARRAMYDASLRGGDRIHYVRSAGAARDPLQEEHYPVSRREGDDCPPRFPFGLVAGGMVAAMVVAFILSGLTDRSPDAPGVDPIMRQGDCVVIESNGDARKVGCEEQHDGVVADFVPFATTCPNSTEPHRDRQGMGLACVQVLG